MALRWISLVALCLVLGSCTAPRFPGHARQFTGVWLYEFEGSTFLEGATEIPKTRPASDEAWLDWTEWPQLERLMEERLWDGDCYTVQPFLITFVGRKTHYPLGGAGHMGLSDSKVTVQRPISAKRLGPSFCYR